MVHDLDMEIVIDHEPVTSHNFLRCITCRCKDCNQFKVDCKEIKKLLTEKVEVKRVNKVTTEVTPTTAVNLCK